MIHPEERARRWQRDAAAALSTAGLVSVHSLHDAECSGTLLFVLFFLWEEQGWRVRQGSTGAQLNWRLVGRRTLAYPSPPPVERKKKLRETIVIPARPSINKSPLASERKKKRKKVFGIATVVAVNICERETGQIVVKKRTQISRPCTCLSPPPDSLRSSGRVCERVSLLLLKGCQHLWWRASLE